MFSMLIMCMFSNTADCNPSLNVVCGISIVYIHDLFYIPLPILLSVLKN